MRHAQSIHVSSKPDDQLTKICKFWYARVHGGTQNSAARPQNNYKRTCAIMTLLAKYSALELFLMGIVVHPLNLCFSTPHSLLFQFAG
jgi:hypothetical protein